MPVTDGLSGGIASINSTWVPSISPIIFATAMILDGVRIAMLSLALIGHDSITDDTVQHPVGGAAD